MPVCSYERLEQCPYERSHQITPDKLMTHLTKCRKQHLKKNPTPTIVICPYKSTHHVDKTEYDYHVKNCDGKDLAIHMLMEPSMSAKKQEHNIPKIIREERNVDYVTDDEDWESQQIRAPYDPATKILEKEVLRKPVGLTKSERREFYVKERERRRFLAERNKAKETDTGSREGTDAQLTPYFVSKNLRTSQKFLYDTADRKSEDESAGTLRRPKLVSTPTRAVASPIPVKNETQEAPKPRLRRPHSIMTPTRNLQNNNVRVSEETFETEDEDHYDKCVAEKLRQLNL